MIERGMIFNAEMVRAILDGRKTQTRRPVKFPVYDKNMGCELSGNELAGEMSAGNYWNSPFSKPGDRLWVRETWSEAGAGAPDLTLYRANYPEHVPSHYENIPAVGDVRWRPSIHMPRWASRILLEITAVRVERLTRISEADAQAEGVAQLRGGYWKHYQPEWTQYQLSARGSFVTLWQAIYGVESWHADPWVWVINFKIIDVCINESS